ETGPAALPTPSAPAAGAPAATAGPAPALNFEAGVDAYYLYNFTGDPNTQGPGARAFDTRSNSFSLNQAKLAVQMNADPVGFRIDVFYGHSAAVGNGAAFVGSTTMPMPALPSLDVALYSGAAIFIPQAYATLKSG